MTESKEKTPKKATTAKAATKKAAPKKAAAPKAKAAAAPKKVAAPKAIETPEAVVAAVENNEVKEVRAPKAPKAGGKTVQMLNIKGSAVGEVSLDSDVFGVEPNIHVMHLALKRQLNNARQGSANTKTRAEVRGGGRKPWRQKGTGRARAGSIRSPLFAGGGVIFGPKPRDYSTSLPQKARKLALKSALSARLEAMIVVKDFSDLKEIKTKAFVKVLSDLKATGKILIIADLKADENKNLELSARNLPNVKLIYPSNLNVKDLIEAQSIITTESAIAEMTERLAK